MKGLNKDLFNNILFDFYNQKDEGMFENTIKLLDSFNFICSFSLGDLLSKKSIKNKNVVVSSSFLNSSYNVENLAKNLIERLQNNTYSNDINIIMVSWLNTISLEDEIKTEEFNFENLFKEKYKLTIRSMGYITFFNNIDIISKSISDKEKKDKNYIGINPIIFF